MRRTKSSGGFEDEQKIETLPLLRGRSVYRRGGDKVKLQDGFGFWFVACKNQCGVMLGYFNAENEAIKARNKRYNKNGINRCAKKLIDKLEVN